LAETQLFAVANVHSALQVSADDSDDLFEGMQLVIWEANP
jgi:hypothetical protein